MAAWALLTLDLDDVDDDARGAFDEEMSARNWSKLKRPFNSYQAHWPGLDPVQHHQQLLAETLKDVRVSAWKAGIRTKVPIAVEFGHHDPDKAQVAPAAQ